MRALWNWTWFKGFGWMAAVSLSACSDDTTTPDVADVLEDTNAIPDILEDTSYSADTLAPDGDDDAVDSGELDTEVEDIPEVPPPEDPFEREDPNRIFRPDYETPAEPLMYVPLRNAGAEEGQLSGWSKESGSMSIASGYPVPFEGSYHFRNSANTVDVTSGTDRIVQTIELSEAVAVERTRIAQLRVMTMTPAEGALEPRVSTGIGLRALSANGTILASRQELGFRFAQYTDTEVALLLPAGTTKVQVFLESKHEPGLAPSAAFFDDVSLALYDREPQSMVMSLTGPPWLMNVGPDKVTVMLETRSKTQVTVEYGESPERLDQRVTSSSPVTTHVLRLTDLKSHTRYWYRVRYDDMTLPPYDFMTARAPEDDGRIEFIMFADNQNGPTKFRELAVRMAEHDPDFLLHGGDVVQNGTRKDYRDTFFSPYYGLGNHAAIWMGPGNHETYSSGIFTSDEARALWEEYVDQPGDEHCFGVRWGKLFVMVIDTEKPHQWGSPQYYCIEQNLKSQAARTATFRTALFHRTPIVTYWDSAVGEPSNFSFFQAGMDAPAVRSDLAPLFEQNGVHLVFTGHNHLYQYIPRYPNTVAWVTSGGAGGSLESGSEESRLNPSEYLPNEPDSGRWFDLVNTQIFGRYHYLRVIIEDRTMWVRAIADDGEVLHAFQVRR